MSEEFRAALEARRLRYDANVAAEAGRQAVRAEQMRREARIEREEQARRESLQRLNQHKIVATMRKDARDTATWLVGIPADAVVARNNLGKKGKRKVNSTSLWMLSKQEIGYEDWPESSYRGPGAKTTFRITTLDDVGDVLVFNKEIEHARNHSNGKLELTPDQISRVALMSKMTSWPISMRPISDSELAPLESVPEIIDPNVVPEIVSNWRAQLLSLITPQHQS